MSYEHMRLFISLLASERGGTVQYLGTLPVDRQPAYRARVPKSIGVNTSTYVSTVLIGQQKKQVNEAVGLSQTRQRQGTESQENATCSTAGVRPTGAAYG